ncbi:MAG: TnpV protein [Oscillospiraceae bacterium]|nr:TnpV protein [Oscillospiraceae bacterium]
MQKSIFEEMGGTYRQEEDYLLPNLTVPETSPIGIWGQRRKRYLREHRGPLYTALLLSGKLDAHLADIDHQAQEMFFQLVEQMAKQEGATERFKKENQMEWVGKMNNIRDRIEEIIIEELISA